MSLNKNWLFIIVRDLPRAGLNFAIETVYVNNLTDYEALYDGSDG